MAAQPRPAVRAAQAVDAVQPDRGALQAGAQRCRRQLAPSDALRQPRFALEGACEANEHDRQPKGGAHARDRDRHQKDQRQKDRQKHQAVGAHGFDDVVQGQVLFGQGREHALDVLGQGVGRIKRIGISSGGHAFVRHLT